MTKISWGGYKIIKINHKEKVVPHWSNIGSLPKTWFQADNEWTTMYSKVQTTDWLSVKTSNLYSNRTGVEHD
jgi:hypothetical protein